MITNNFFSYQLTRFDRDRIVRSTDYCPYSILDIIIYFAEDTIEWCKCQSCLRNYPLTTLIQFVRSIT